MLTDYQKVRIVELYASGESTLKIGRLLQLSPTTVNRQLHRFGVTLREPRETSTRCQVRHDAFDEISQDAAYWIGFLFADGSVSSDGQSGRVSVRVSERDRNQLVKFRTFLGSTHKVGNAPAGNYGGYRSKPSVRISIPSVRLSQQLLSLGRYQGPINDLLIQSSDFWRGVVDGDGSLGIPGVGVCILWARRLTQAARSIFALSQE